ncbi:MarR family winged helix-turn-helix transcriptional regulator [Pedobacter mucosus]|uniref:MarR family winged helix-turn-helix transcriptional regulator n=1 Tax=Pedobacter mucosus TaxID=2895286 RepID=UPI001EE4B934|nr:MarR family transcriptional regulator [Pedobacter mucosus]UKT64262.1 MarR family transcriptional regulator [Pedobacter mucosus]
MNNDIDFQFKNPEDSPGYLMGQLTLLWQRKHKRVLDPLDLTQTQFVLLAALAWLSKTNDCVTQVDIANQGNADRMMVSKVLRLLEEKKFIIRAAHKTDTRAKKVSLTTSGALVLQKALTAIENADLEFFSSSLLDISAFNAAMVKLIQMNKGA